MSEPKPPPIICQDCKNYIDIKEFDVRKGIESDFRNVCKAFPEGIPEVIMDGKNKHSKPLPDQKNDIVFERKRRTKE